MFASRYAALRSAQPMREDEGAAFDDHVFACIVAAAFDESARQRQPLAQALGLAGADAERLFARWLPFQPAPFCLSRPSALGVADEEALLRDLLTLHRAPGDEAADALAPLIARRAMRDDHLWQDLGLMNRGELNRLLQRHFPSLHAANVDNMRWKKFFYRQICEMEGFSLCSAPHCSVCVDFAACFGDEDGMSRLASIARAEAAA